MIENSLREIAEREIASRSPVEIRCCVAAGCLAAHSAAVLENLRSEVLDQGVQSKVAVRPVGCLRLCGQGPLVRIEPNGQLYERVAPDQSGSIVRALSGGSAEAKVGDLNSPFFRRQASVVLEHCGVIEPERIESAIAVGAYATLQRVLRDLAPEQVVEAVGKSGLRGRGGAGYPTGVKWDLVASAKGARKFVVCNADEGDPGAFMNRSELESDPHRILEGMAIAGYAVGASRGYIYVRGEYPLAIRRLRRALEQAGRLGLFGKRLFGSSFNFQIEIRIGAGAFVCGEETALIASIEGKRGLPSPRPPYPAEFGLWGCPTLIQNVETFANIPVILHRGADWFASIGARNAPGTKVFALTGQVKNVGLVEVPLGTPISTIVEEIGGGAPDGAGIKAVQTGGPSGGCIPASLFATPVDYDSLRQVGSMMGSGGMIVLDQKSDMADLARFFMEFCKDESCGKCIPCRAGTVEMLRLLTKIVNGSGTRRDFELLQSLCEMVGQTSLCGLGQSAPNPVLSTIRHFREEYEARLVNDPVLPVIPAVPS